ncbi:DUF6279 family lipoprotein [Shewanella sp. C32]|uniref:DUF6279 family lipoprotein n=1 Tax=Shewanella electrica TaxID=515560 RepID=A0ABT2FK81_9GAMM|nr:DUF6279 family lipoprotein [Shewanella electrica]MCH1923534.1 DUF6279 family lipoprotein [Shewanella electrica]MCS4555631.1 DUF6279 family lipoprotein [Shewanella electrica]
MKRLLTITSLLLLLTACSTKMSYHFMDWAIEWGLEDYVSLNDQQDDQFDQLLTGFIKWHKTSELPKYAADLRGFRQHISDNNFSPDYWLQFTDKLRDHWYNIFSQCFEQAWPLVQSLSDEQVTQINDKLTKEQKELDEEYAGKSHEALIKQADQRLEDTLDDWLGSVTKQQKQLVHQYNSEREFTTDMWLEYRHEWYRQFKQTLVERDNTPQLKTQLKMLLTAPQQLRSQDYQQKLQQNTYKFGEWLVALQPTLTAKQQRHLLNKLDELIEDLDELAAEGD